MAIDILSNEVPKLGAMSGLALCDVGTPGTQPAIVLSVDGEYGMHDFVHEHRAAETVSLGP